MSTLPISWRTLLTHPENVIEHFNLGIDISEPQPTSLAAALFGGLGGLMLFGTGGPDTTLLGVMAGPGLGIAALYAGGALLWRLGRFFGGRGTPGGVRAALALAFVPLVLLALLAALLAVMVPAGVSGVVVGCFILFGLPALLVLALKLWGWAARLLAAALELTLFKAHAVGALGVVVLGAAGAAVGMAAGALRLL